MPSQETQGAFRQGDANEQLQAARMSPPSDWTVRRPGIYVPNPATPCRSGEFNPGGTAWLSEPPPAL
jgi:hypothetical protein